MNYIILISGISFLVLVFSILIVRWKFPRLWFIFQVKILRRKGLSKKAVKKELEDSKKYKYEKFEDFLRDCPKYQIDDSILGNIIRNIWKSAGAEFQQHVWIRKNDMNDKTAWLRREEKFLIHEGGTYFMPWKWMKSVFYHVEGDSRPLLDLTEEMDWENGDMCADVVTAVTNSKNMAGLNGEEKPVSIYIWIMIALAAGAIILQLFQISMGGKTDEQTYTLLKMLANQSGITP